MKKNDEQKVNKLKKEKVKKKRKQRKYRNVTMLPGRKKR